MPAKSLVALGVSTLLSFSAAADDISGDEMGDLSLEALMNISVEVATKSKKSLTDSPSTVSVFTALEIESLGIDNLQDLLNLVPGFQSKATGGHGLSKTVAARGRRASQNGFEVLVLYDGQRLNNDRSGAAVQLNAELSLSNIERVEIIRGPGSAIYGSNAFTGVVNLVTKKGKNQFEGFVGEHNSYGGSLSLSGEQSQFDWDLFVGAWSKESPDIVGWSFGQNLIAKAQDDGLDTYLKATFGNLTFRARYMDRDTEGAYVIENIVPDFNHSSQSQGHLNIKYQGEIFDEYQLSVYGFYMNTDWTFQTSLFPPGAMLNLSNPPSAEPTRGRNTFKSQEVGLGAELSWMVAEHSEVLIGTVFRDPKVDDAVLYNNFDLGQLVNNQFPINYYGTMEPTTLVMKGQNRTIFGLFAQYDTRFGDNLLATFGVRYDDYSDFGATTNPRVGLVYKLSDIHTLKASFGQAFRAPSSSETGLDNNPIIIGNENLQPEKVKTWEVNWSQKYQSMKLSITLFDNTFEDAVRLVPAPNSTKVQWNNSTEYENNGVEVDLFASLTEGVYLRAGYSKYFDMPADAFFLSDEMLTASINFQMDKWQFNLNGFYHSDTQNRSAAGFVPLDDYWVFNGKVQYDVSERWSVSLVAKNLFDETYHTTDGNMNSPMGVTNPGRSIHLSSKYEF